MTRVLHANQCACSSWQQRKQQQQGMPTFAQALQEVNFRGSAIFILRQVDELFSITLLPRSLACCHKSG